MTVARIVSPYMVRCDHPSCRESLTLPTAQTADAAWQAAVNQGWRKIDGYDRCPLHAARKVAQHTL